MAIEWSQIQLFFIEARSTAQRSSQSLSICTSVCVSLCLCLSISLCLSVCLCLCLSASLWLSSTLSSTTLPPVSFPYIFLRCENCAFLGRKTIFLECQRESFFLLKKAVKAKTNDFRLKRGMNQNIRRLLTLVGSRRCEKYGKLAAKINAADFIVVIKKHIVRCLMIKVAPCKIMTAPTN